MTRADDDALVQACATYSLSPAGPGHLGATVWLDADPGIYQRFLDDAEIYWRSAGLRTDAHAVVYAEGLHHDIRGLLRNLTIANALRRLVPARLVVLTGSDSRWLRSFDAQFDVSLVAQMARAYGADDVVDIHALADRRLAGPERTPASEPNRTPSAQSGRPSRIVRPISEARLAHCVDATFCRLERVPRITPRERATADYATCVDRAAVLTEIFDELFAAAEPVALITSHVDYDQWGLAVQAARRAAVPVIHTQSTGSLKAYALFPTDDVDDREPIRATLTPRIGEFFEQRIWAHRDRFRRNAERVAWRARGNLGRPSWWRGGGGTPVEMTNAVERRQIRVHAAARFGLDPDRPTVAVFCHAVSDAPGANREAFPDLAGWFEQTAAYAANESDVNWLLLDHPSQIRYDTTGFFDGVAERYAGAGHMVFRPSVALSKNVLWSLADLGLTVRGSISNEMPAYGIPVIQAGWSEWSACGLSQVATDPATYWRLLDTAIGRLAASRPFDPTGVPVSGDCPPLITEEQVARARLWLWLYRSAADVVSGLVPTWDMWPADHLLQSVRVYMRQVETDDEPLFAAVERMWRDREPVLTRIALPRSGAQPTATAGKPVSVPATTAGTQVLSEPCSEALLGACQAPGAARSE